MKSKPVTYMLIAVVLVIWGVILWKVFSPKDDSAPLPPPQKRAETTAPAADTLLLDYRDPFLGATAKKPAAKPAVTTRVAAPPPPEPPPPVEHRLRYMGSISRGGVPYGLVEINGTLHTIRRGETADGYRLETVWQDSVKLRWKNENIIRQLGT